PARLAPDFRIRLPCLWLAVEAFAKAVVIPAAATRGQSINYVPQLSNTTLLGRLTQSTFTLEQPLGQFENVSLSDPDPIWLVIAHSNATQNFAAPQKVEDTHAPASFGRNGYYFTMRASRVHYQGGQSGSQLRVLRVGNDTHCSLTSRGCNSPLPGAGPYRVKFLVMNATGPVAETEWSEEIYLQQAQTFQGAPESRSKGTVVIIAFLSILLAVFLILVIAAWMTWVSPDLFPEKIHGIVPGSMSKLSLGVLFDRSWSTTRNGAEAIRLTGILTYGTTLPILYPLLGTGPEALLRILTSPRSPLECELSAAAPDAMSTACLSSLSWYRLKTSKQLSRSPPGFQHQIEDL
ncbi:hypothetical protein STEG23_020616, partial [Scotinomys teguina]